jgi:hypothetical protein
MFSEMKTSEKFKSKYAASRLPSREITAGSIIKLRGRISQIDVQL